MEQAYTGGYLFKINVDEEWPKLLTVSTHRGLHKYNRLPFDMKVTPCNISTGYVCDGGRLTIYNSIPQCCIN